MKSRIAPLKPILVSWIGHADLKAAAGEAGAGLGPIAQAVAFKEFARVVLLSDAPADSMQGYRDWLQQRTGAVLDFRPVTLSSPIHFGEIYQAARQVLAELTADPATAPALTIHLSPGTPAMAAVWIILAKTRFPAELIQSSAKHGVEVATVPFDLAAEFLPDLLHQADRRLSTLSAGEAPAWAEFSAIIYRSAVMERLVTRAHKVALRSAPVLIEGESGTGKELLARAIHAASPRRAQPFIAVNCGAIPAELVESELFGHEKGAFTGAVRERKGDLSLLIERLLEQVNQEGREDPGYQQKNLSPGARNRMLAYHWPDNVRELLNTLRRAALWSEGETITEADLREALLLLPARENDHRLEQPLVPGFNLADLLAKVARYYLQQALAETQGNKTQAAEMLAERLFQRRAVRENAGQ